MNPTGSLSRTLRFLSRVLCFPLRAGSTGEDNADGSTPQRSPQGQIPLPTQEQEGLDGLHLEEHSSKSTVGNRTERVLITHIRTTNVAIRLRRIPIGFYVAVKTENEIKRTSNKPASVGKDVVEWDDKIVFPRPSDQSSRISLTVFASFELGPTLGDGEALREVETTVGELLDRDRQFELIRFVEQCDGDVNSSLSSFEVEIERRVYGQNEYTATPNPPESEETRRLVELTDRGHHALIRYREHQEQRDLDESIKYFEHAQDLCPPHHPSRATVLSNLATAKLIYCRANDAPTDLDVPINLYQDALHLRPRDHPDHPFTLLSLGVVLTARFQRQQDEANWTRGKSILSEVLDVASTDSYTYHAAVLALCSTAEPKLIQPREIPQTVENDLDDDREVQRLDAALQWISHPESWKHVLRDHLGILFCSQFSHIGDLVEPERAISMLEVLVQFASNNHPDKPLWLNSLGGLLLIRYKRFGDVADLERSISLREAAVEFTPDGHPEKPLWINSLSYSLSTRYERFGDVVDLERSILLGEDAVQFTPDGHPDKPSRLNNLGDSLSTRYEHFGGVTDLERSISLFQDAVQLTPDGHPNKPIWLTNFGDSLCTHYKRFGDITDLERSISLFRDAIRFTPDGHADKPSRLNNLGHSLWTRYERFGDVTDLGRSISLREDAVQFTPEGHPDKPAWLINLSSLLWTRYKCVGDTIDLERSISLGEDAVKIIPDGHPNKPLYFTTLGHSLSARYQRFGDLVDLERSISLFENAVQFTPDEHPRKPFWLHNLGDSFLIRYKRFGDAIDLERSVSLFQKAVQFTPDGDPDKALRLNLLGHSFCTRYKRFADVTDLESSISLFEDAVQLTPDGHPNKPLCLSNLGYSLSTRYERSGDLVDLERSISLREDAVQFTPDGHPRKPLWLNNLGRSLFIRYKRLGDVVDLERSISLSQDGLQLTPDRHPDKPLWLNNLGDSLFTRYERFGDVTDLERSISLGEDAAQFTPDGHTDRPLWLINLGGWLLTRYKRFGDLVDLERSISLREDAVQFTPNEHPDKPSRLSNLGHSLWTRYERFRDVTHLQKSISLFEDAVQLIPDGHSNKPSLLNNLGRSLWTRYERFGDVADLERSISLGEDAVQSTPKGHPDEPKWLNSLAFSLLDRFQRSGDSDQVSGSDFSRAILYSSRAACSPTGSFLDRFKASQIWIRCARLLQRDTQSLLDACTVAIDLLPQLAWMGLSLHDRYYQLLQAADVSRDAAAAALEAHKPTLAIEWLEQGRSIVWSQFSQLRAPVDGLRYVYPDLAAQFERISHELEHASVQDRGDIVNVLTAHSNMKVGVLEEEAQQHHALALSRERLLAEIRALPGFERFLLPKTIKQLSSLSVPHSGPVIFLNASRYRCDAIVVTAGSEDVVHVPLSNTNYDEVAGMQLGLGELLRLKGRDMLRDDSGRGARVRGKTPDDVFRSILPCLWEKVVNPILEALSLSTSDGRLPRIFWCPTGPFSFLPIHAAGIYSETSPGPKLSDFAISSYIPTMSAFEPPPQDDSEPTSRNIRLLAVPQPSTDGQPHLTGVREEIEIIRKLASSSSFVDVQEADGTVGDVLSKMTETDWVHFACHGTQDRTDPYDSGFLLAHGKRLKLPDISRLSRPQGGLAFLSACHTATGDEQLSEEAIYIAAGMLLAGYRGMIATMWSIMDDDAPKIAEDVYKSLFGDGKVPDSSLAAEALHHAIERLRNSGASFLSWVPFIHVGL